MLKDNIVKRLNWVDGLRGFLILLVILGHSIQYFPGIEADDNHLWNMIYSFHMPAFMAVSGFLNYRSGRGRRDRGTIIYHRLFQLLIPFFVWSLISSLSDASTVFYQLVDDIKYPDRSFWFLWALFWISILFVCTDYLSEKIRIKQEIGECVAAVVLVGIMTLTEFRYFGFQFIAYYFLFYIAGYYYRKNEKYIPDNKVVVGLLIFLWAILAWFYSPHRLPDFLREAPLVPSALLLYGYRFATSTIACFVLFALAPKVLDTNNLINRILWTFGKVSLGMYVVHLLLCRKLVVCMVNTIGMNSTELIIITFILLTSISYGLVYLLGKNKYTAKFLLGKL